MGIIGFFTDVFSMSDAVGVQNVVIILLLLALGAQWYYKLRKTSEEFQLLAKKIDETLSLLKDAATTEGGQIVSQSKQMFMIEDVAKDLLVHSEKCLTYHANLSNAENDIKEIRSDIEGFVSDGKESRANIQRLVENINERLDNFMTLVAGILRSFVEREKASGDK